MFLVSCNFKCALSTRIGCFGKGMILKLLILSIKYLHIATARHNFKILLKRRLGMSVVDSPFSGHYNKFLNVSLKPYFKRIFLNNAFKNQ